MASIKDSVEAEYAHARALVTAAGLRGLLYAFLPIPVTLLALYVSPFLPYSVGSLVSFAIVAACIALAIYYGARALRASRGIGAATTAPDPRGRRSAISLATEAAAVHAIVVRRRIGVTAIVVSAVQSVFLFGNLALNIPELVWLVSLGR